MMRLRTIQYSPAARAPPIIGDTIQLADGKATVLSLGRLAAAYRKTGKAPFDTLGLPWNTGLAADQQPLTPGKPVQLDFAMTPVGRVIPAGHRLRVVVTGADPRQRNLADIRLDPPPEITVLTGAGADSRIELPLAPVQALAMGSKAP